LLVTGCLVAAAVLPAGAVAAAPSGSPTSKPSGTASPSHRASSSPSGQPSGTVASPQACGPSYSATDHPLTHVPWPLRRLRPDLAWPLSRGQGVTVAVIDSGVSAAPPVLSGQVLAGQDYVAGDGDGACDESGHGTMVGAIIAGRDGTGPYHGVAPDAKILPVRVLRDTRSYPSSEVDPLIAQAVRWAADHGADVINLSLNTSDSAAVRQAVTYAQRKNIVVVAAAGNQGGSDQQGDVEYPAAFPGVLAVAGVDAGGAHVASSNTASYVDVAAPGDDIEGPAPRGGGYAVFPEGGTSFAAPYVSGLAALLRGYFPAMPASQLVRRIQQTADHPPGGWNDQVGYGVVDPYRALTEILAGAGAGGTVAPAGPLHASAASGQRTSPLVAAAAWTAAAVLAAAALIALGAYVLPRGRRRHWRPGRAPPPA
jgi:type VII secretion-associated serine protease mycosin